MTYRFIVAQMRESNSRNRLLEVQTKGSVQCRAKFLHAGHARIARRASLSQVRALAPSGKSAADFRTSRLDKRGVSRSSRHAGWDAMDVAARSGVSTFADERAATDGEIVWSWPPGAEAQRNARKRVVATQGQESRSLRRARISVKTIAQGRPVVGHTCGSAVCFFAARGPWVSVDTRPSLRPLAIRGQCFRKARARHAPRECGCMCRAV
jgi:hypothetical protein